MKKSYLNLYRNQLGEMYEKLTDKKVRKSIGMYYTPNFIVDYMLMNTVMKIDIVENPWVKLLDPSCGAGYFLTRAYDILKEKFLDNLEILREKYSNNIYLLDVAEKNNYTPIEVKGYDYWIKDNLHYHILKNCLYGADIDAAAIEIVKKNLLRKDLSKAPICMNIVQGDSLIKWEEISNFTDEKAIERYSVYNNIGRLDYKDICNKIIELKDFWNNSFDFIIGNPPYVVLLQSNLNKNYWSYIVNNYRTIGYKKNVFYLLIERVLKKLKENGTHSFIVPDRYFFSSSYTKSRKKLISNLKVTNITQFSNKVFKDAIVGTALYIGKRCTYDNTHDISIKLNYVNEKNYCLTKINQSNLIKDKRSVVNIITKDEYRRVVKKIDNLSKPLRNLSNIHVGMMIKNKNQCFSQDFLHNENRIVIGRDLGEYIIQHDRRYCDINNVEIFGGTKDLKKHKEYPKILLRKTGSSIVASLDEKGILAEQSAYLIIPSEKNKVYNILGQVQSNICNFYFKEVLITNPEAYPYIQHYDVEKLPINEKLIGNKNFEDIVKKIISIKYEIKNIEFNQGLSKNNYEKIIHNYKAAKEKQISLNLLLNKYIKDANYHLYEAYGFTSEEINLIEGRLNKYKNTKNNRFKKSKNSKNEFYNDLINAIYELVIKQVENLLEVNQNYLFIEEIRSMLMKDIENYKDILSILDNYEFESKHSDKLKNILTAYSESWNIYVRNKSLHRNYKEIIRYNKDSFGLSRWPDKIHECWFSRSK
ncbi:Eco57I restriction-modification methylase domain-containing protein [Clostridium sp. DJ247]|uniref:Eco57I restriction-modification methylase domain-containing protein n=1 Tax=Clostridium sp. DJ247 TaxID=2726188 RepID=UPI001628C9AC|nr:TaqI-like C-terminal specificity domain-containing protein [Clostridium sp. DJ247]MBC2579222.1 hypothetical protein [Clostridium sp. DJ247]MBC2579327.1 hypothetical protein [Clostridium sp. DJ247]